MESTLTFILNNQIISTKINPATVLLDFIRKDKNLSGTKEVCKEGDCGACAVLLGTNNNGIIKYKTINSCLYPIQKVQGKHVVSLEGLNNSEITSIQKAFVEEGASQCGFCTPGFIISLTGYLLNAKKFDDIEAVNAVAGNICRCTGYHSIIRSIKNIGKSLKDLDKDILIKKKIIPEYFKNIDKMMVSVNDRNSNSNTVSAEHFQLISGGTDLFVQRPEELLSNKVEFIENIVESYIKIEDNFIIISGSATIDEFQHFIENNVSNLNLNKLFKLFASQPIRNSATIAGNVINASPIADFTITLLALNTILLLESPESQTREVELNKFYKGYKTLNKEKNEIIKELRFKIPASNDYFNFEKVSKRTHLDIASVNSAILLKVDKNKIIEATISAGGVSPIPLFLKKSSKYLIGKTISDDLVLSFLQLVKSEISPISDIRGSKEYKELLLIQLIKAHFIDLFPNIITHKVLYE